LSGGEKQRVAVARAFLSSPRLLICDEATSALDVSVQASVLNLLNDLQGESGTSYMFISHDLNVVNYISDHVLVMYLGRVCEYGRRDEVVTPPYHPYTEALLSAAPEVDPSRKRKTIRLEGSPPNPTRKIVGCPFAGRCHKKIGDICDKVPPPKVDLSDSHYIYCHLPLEKLSGEARL
jgi:peptide/nickel transport system ATP-binding protein